MHRAGRYEIVDSFRLDPFTKSLRNRQDPAVHPQFFLSLTETKSMKTSHLIIVLLLIIALAVIFTTVFKSDTYSDFKQARKNPGQEVQIIGHLIKDKPMIMDTLNGPRFRFYMTDNHGDTARIFYPGARPQDFIKLQQVVVIGHWQDSLFLASSLLLKCPSKYKDDKPESFGSTNFSQE